MAPVGSYESLMAAIQGGADSIYFGIEGLNMRARSSNNFTTEDLRRIASICQEHGLKSYLTVNTVIYGEDLPLMRTILCRIAECQFDCSRLKQVIVVGCCTVCVHKFKIQVSGIGDIFQWLIWPEKNSEERSRWQMPNY